MNQISFITNTSVNTLDHVKLLIKSLRDNLFYDKHEILVFVDSDNENTIDFLKQEKNNFYDLKIITHKLKPCVGYSRNNNLLVELASHEIVSYLQSDMVISKNYDKNILEDLEDNMILSSTRIEPPLHGLSDKTITKDFGIYPEEFKYSEFLTFAESVKSNKIQDYFFAPYTFYKKVWMRLGGYDTLFRRSREDSDFVQRCLHSGVKLKQTYKANVYHFSCVTSRGKAWFESNNEGSKKRVETQKLADSIELNRFFMKWGGFNHGESLLKKYDIDIVIKGDRNIVSPIAYQLQPFFSRVWVESEELRSALISEHSDDHSPANELLNFSDSDWQESKKYYNQLDYEKIFQVGEPKEYNVKFEFDVSNPRFFNNDTITAIPLLIEQTEPGDYESEGCTLSIRKAVDITPPYKVENPPFDMSLLTIE